MQQAMSFIRQNPLEAARRAVVRLVRFVGIEGREFFYFYTNNLLGPIAQPWLVGLILLLILPWAFTLILGAAGLWLTWFRESKLVWLVGLYLVSYLLPHVAIIAEPRFHLTWVPVLMPFAVYGWSARRIAARATVVYSPKHRLHAADGGGAGLDPGQFDEQPAGAIFDPRARWKRAALRLLVNNNFPNLRCMQAFHVRIHLKFGSSSPLPEKFQLDYCQAA